MARGVNRLEEEDDDVGVRKDFQSSGPPNNYGSGNSIPRLQPVPPIPQTTSYSTVIPTQQDKIGGEGYSPSKMKQSNWRLLGLGMFFLFYLALGASVFSAIESPIEQREIKDLIAKKMDFLHENECIDERSLEKLISAIVDADNRGVALAPMANGHSGSNTSVPSWSFGQSFFFASTVVTTIGYGHQSPLSTSGKVFCMLYGLIGIPLTMLLLTAVVERLLIPTTLLLQWMNKKLGHMHTPFCIRVLHLLIVLTTVICLLFLVPAAIFAALEPSWSYPDALYYCFISLTTIGLGDFIPGDNIGQPLRPFYKACTTIYLLIGVTAMMLTLSVFYSIPEFDVSTLFLLSCGSGVDANLGNGGNIPTERSSGGRSAGDPERIHLQASAGPQYSQQVNDSESLAGSGSMERLQTRRVVRARSRPDEDTPDEEEVPTPGPSGRSRIR